MFLRASVPQLWRRRTLTLPLKWWCIKKYIMDFVWNWNLESQKINNKKPSFIRDSFCAWFSVLLQKEKQQKKVWAFRSVGGATKWPSGISNGLRVNPGWRSLKGLSQELCLLRWRPSEGNHYLITTALSGRHRIEPLPVSMDDRSFSIGPCYIRGAPWIVLYD